jgi:phage I-like protein
MQAKLQQLEQKVVRKDEERLYEASGRVETQVVALKQIIQKAREEGDISTEIEANTRLTSLIHEQRQIAEANEQRKAYQEQLAYQQQQPQPVVQQARPVVDEKAANWVDNNPWYGRDTVLTSAAWGIHRQLIEVEGFDGRTDEYYDELDRRLKSTFPNRFGKDRATRTVQTVAPATRSTGVNNARRVVKLTASQVAIAKKLGVPIEEYAKYVKE